MRRVEFRAAQPHIWLRRDGLLQVGPDGLQRAGEIARQVVVVDTHSRVSAGGHRWQRKRRIIGQSRHRHTIAQPRRQPGAVGQIVARERQRRRATGQITARIVGRGMIVVERHLCPRVDDPPLRLDTRANQIHLRLVVAPRRTLPIVGSRCGRERLGQLVCGVLMSLLSLRPLSGYPSAEPRFHAQMWATRGHRHYFFVALAAVAGG